MRAKYPEIVKLIEARLHAGDYSVAGIPSERKIAQEFGVGHMTARRAVQHLVQQGALRRPALPRRVARPKQSKRQLQVSLVLPAFDSPIVAAWYGALHQLVASREGVLRLVPYTHAADPAIYQELQSDFDALFFAPPSNPSSLLLDALAAKRDRVITLWQNYTHLGLVCVDVAPPNAPGQMIEYLASLGHRTIDCLNTEPSGEAVRLRVDHWRQTLDKLGLQGTLHDYPVRPFEQAGIAALATMRTLLAERKIDSTAIFCTSVAPAIATIRACHEAGLRVPHDLSVATTGGMAMATITTPTITTIEPGDFVSYMGKGLDMVLSGLPTDPTKLHIFPKKVNLWIGESTGPAVR